MKALGSCEAPIPAPPRGSKSLSNNRSRPKSNLSGRPFVVNRWWVPLNHRPGRLRGTAPRCSIVCLTENDTLETKNTHRSTMVIAGGASGRYVKEVGSGELSSQPEAWRRLFEDGPEVKLHFLEERDEEVLSGRVVSLSRSNRMRSAMEMYLSMERAGLVLNPHGCNSLIACVLRNGSVVEAFGVFERMRKRGGVTGHAYSLLLKAVAVERGGDCALSMFLDLEEEGLHKGMLDIIVYNTMLTICGKLRNWREAERMWVTLKKHGFHGTRVTYCLLISTFVRCGQTDLALVAFHEMIQNGFEVDVDNMKAIVVTCTSEGRWDVALDLLKKMLEKGSKPNVVLFNAVINCLGKAGEVDLALETFDLLRCMGHDPDMYTWNAMLNALYRGRHYADCLCLFSAISKKYSSNITFHVFNTVLLSCQKLGLWSRSLKILWQMESCGMEVPTSSYNLVLGACERAQRPEIALQVYQHMAHRKCPSDNFTILTLIRTCIWGSLWKDIESILENVEPDVSLYNALIQGLFLRGNITLAKKMYIKMHDNGLEADGKTRALMLQCLSSRRNRYGYAKQK